MYLDELNKLIRKNIIFIFTLVIIGALVAYFSTTFLASGYNLKQTVFLKAESTQLENNLDVQNLTDTSTAVLASLDFQNSIKTGAVISVKKLAPQVIEISTTSPSIDTTKLAQKSIVEAFNLKSANLIKHAKVELIPLGEPQQPTKKILNSKVLAVFGAVLGLVVSLTVISISKFFRI